MRKLILVLFILTGCILLKAETLVFKDKQIIKGKIIKIDDNLFYCESGGNLLIIERKIVKQINDDMGEVVIETKEGWINYNNYTEVIKLNHSNYREKIPVIKNDMKTDKEPLFSIIDLSFGKSSVNRLKAKDSVQGGFYLGRKNLYFGFSLNFMLYNERETFIPKSFPCFSAGLSMIKKTKFIDFSAEMQILRIKNTKYVYEGYNYWDSINEEIWTPAAKAGLRKELFKVVIIKVDAGLYPYKKSFEPFLSVGIGFTYSSH